jgi:DNA segregation ATPase FtsK/SpoIIIE-like protein
LFGISRQNHPHEVAFVFIDLKGGQALEPFARYIHSPFPVATNPKDAEGLLKWLVDLMKKRYEGKAGGPHIFLCIDEMLWLMRDVKDADVMLGTLTSIARAADIHVIIASQEASKRSLGDTLVSRNIIYRLCGKVDTASSAFWATGVEKSGAESLLGRGDMIAYDGERLRRVQIARIFKQDLDILPLDGKNKREIPIFPKSDKTQDRRGGHNKIPIEDEWIEAFQDGLTITEVMKQFDLSSSVAYRAKAVANNGH